MRNSFFRRVLLKLCSKTVRNGASHLRFPAIGLRIKISLEIGQYRALKLLEFFNPTTAKVKLSCCSISRCRIEKKNSNRFCTRRMWLTTGLSHPLYIMQFTSVLSMCLTKAARLLCSTCCVIDILGWREEKIRWRQPTCDSLYCGSLHLQRRVAQVATGQTPRSRCGDGSQTRVPYVMMTLDTIRSTFRSNLCLSLPLHCGIIKFFFLKNQVPPHWDVFERITFTVKDDQMKDLQRFCPCFPTIIFSCFTCRQQDVSRINWIT